MYRDWIIADLADSRLLCHRGTSFCLALGEQTNERHLRQIYIYMYNW